MKVKREFVTDKQVGRIITEMGMEALAEKMKETVIDSTKNDEVVKNV